jgi:hypothetical protein
MCVQSLGTLKKPSAGRSAVPRSPSLRRSGVTYNLGATVGASLKCLIISTNAPKSNRLRSAASAVQPFSPPANKGARCTEWEEVTHCPRCPRQHHTVQSILKIPGVASDSRQIEELNGSAHGPVNTSSTFSDATLPASSILICALQSCVTSPVGLSCLSA